MISKRRTTEIARHLHEAYSEASTEKSVELIVDAAYGIADVLKADNPKFSQADFLKVVLGR